MLLLCALREGEVWDSIWGVLSWGEMIIVRLRWSGSPWGEVITGCRYMRVEQIIKRIHILLEDALCM